LKDSRSFSTDRLFQILGAESCKNYDNRFCAQLLIRHVESVKKNIYSLKDATAIVIIESNFGNIANELASILEQAKISKIKIVYTHDKTKCAENAHPGTHIYNANKVSLVQMLMRALHYRRIKFHVRFASYGASKKTIERNDDDDENIVDMRELILKELESFTETKTTVLKKGGDPYVKITYSGKVEDNKDDYVIALVLVYLAKTIDYYRKCQHRNRSF